MKLVCLLLLIIGNASANQLVVVPDIQRYSGYAANQALLTQQVQWIVDNIENEDIAFVTQLGDIVHSRNADVDKDLQWQFADRAWQPLHHSIPYSLAYGNHDIDDGQGVNSFHKAQKYFGAERYRYSDWFGGSSPDGASFFQFFKIADQQLMHVAIKFSPDDETLSWADSLIREQGLPTIISTHAYLTDAGRARGGGGTVEAGREQRGEVIWNGLVRKNNEIFMVIGGHNHAGQNIQVAGEYGEDGEYHQVSVNDAGKEVIELLANYQDYPNGGDGWLQLARFDLENNKLSVRTYSTYHAIFQTDAMSHFEIPFDFKTRWLKE
jgi:hypothetical protein